MLIWLGEQLLEQADKREIKEEATVTQKTATLEQTQEDGDFLRRAAAENRISENKKTQGLQPLGLLLAFS